MKQKGEELIVMSKKMFFLILAGLSVIGILLGFSIGYITAPVKEIKIQKTEETDRTVLPSTVETALAKKQELLSPQSETKKEQPPQAQIEEKKAKEIEIQIAKKEEPKQTKEIGPSQKTQELEKKDETLLIKKHKKLVKTPTNIFYTIQVGAFSEISNARAFMEKVKSAGYKVTLSREEIYKVRVGNYIRFSQAKKVSEELRYKGFDNFILKIKETSKGGKQ
ncbi:MAG: SPOR domain-containing protein [Thermodesulfovibrio sp.]|nr:SPOR domain-containing protein [Thermodesulfovibrio sp.]